MYRLKASNVCHLNIHRSFRRQSFIVVPLENVFEIQRIAPVQYYNRRRINGGLFITFRVLRSFYGFIDLDFRIKINKFGWRFKENKDLEIQIPMTQVVSTLFCAIP